MRHHFHCFGPIGYITVPLIKQFIRNEILLKCHYLCTKIHRNWLSGLDAKLKRKKLLSHL